VASEAASQARNLVEEARGQVEEQSRSQRDRLVAMLSSFSDDLDSMRHEESGTEGTQGLAADAVRMVSERARDLSVRLDGREPRELIEDVRGFARRRPGSFLLGSLAAGVVAGRLLRGAKDAAGASGSGSSGSAEMQHAQSAGTYDPVHAAVDTSPPTTVDEPVLSVSTPYDVPTGGLGELGGIDPDTSREMP
jgi:hypothetical protein